MKIKSLIVLILSLCFISSAVFSAETMPVTTITTAEGEVMVFEYFGTGRGEIAIGKFIERVNEHSAKVKIKNNVKLCYIPFDMRNQIPTTTGAAILVQKNTRRIYGTDWDIIAVSKVIEAGYEFSKGNVVVAKAEAVAQIVQMAKGLQEGIATAEAAFVTETKVEVATEAIKESAAITEAVAAAAPAPAAAPTATTTTTVLESPTAESREEASFPEPTLQPDTRTPDTDTGGGTTTSTPSITTSSALTSGQEGTAYSQTLAATDGTTPYTWSLTSGSLPSGLSLSSGGVISGTPATGSAGSYSFTITVTDANSETDSAAFTLTITAASTATLTVSTTSVSNGSVGVVYSQTLSATGGTTPYTWSIASGSLPAASGLSLSSGGVISGTPAQGTGGTTYTFTVRVTDSVAATADSGTLTIKISGYNWGQSNTSGFDDTSNTSTNALISFNSRLYGGTSNSLTGCEVWRGTSGINNDWTRVANTGFDIPTNLAVLSMASHSVSLYAGTERAAGGRIYMTGTGTSWLQVSTDGLGDTSNTAISALDDWGGYLYAGTVRSGVGRLYRSSDGNNYSSISITGFSGNTEILSIESWGSNIYLTTRNDSSGGSVWQSSTGGSGTWSKVSSDGFGSALNTHVRALTVFGSNLYAGTTNTSTGGQIWRSSNGTTWTQANTSGFGTANNTSITCLVASSGYLYAGTTNGTDGAQVWQSSNGTTWAQVNTSGFGSANNTSITSMIWWASTYLIVGTQNTNTGTQVWALSSEAYADPNITGRVYDSVTGDVISSPTISIYPKDSTTALSSTTANPYSFNVNNGYYYFRVEKEGYTFPSNTKNGVVAGDHGENFYASGTSMGIDIPIDQGYPLEITKTANKKNVVPGDIVTFDVKIRNNSMWAFSNINILDDITNGFKYVEDRTYVDSTRLAETNVSISNRRATFKLTNVAGYATTHLTYQARVGTGMVPGEYKTKAVAWDRVRDWRMSNETSCQVNVIYDALFTLGTIIGKVFYDVNGNGVQDKGEKGISGVTIASEYGVIVETDKDGKYHIPSVPPGTHLLKVDIKTLPKDIGQEFTTENPYMVKITEGLLAKVNFGVKSSSIAADQPLAEKEEKEKTGKLSIVAVRAQEKTAKTNIVIRKKEGRGVVKKEIKKIEIKPAVVQEKPIEEQPAKKPSAKSNIQKREYIKDVKTKDAPKNKENKISECIKEIADQFFIVALGEGVVRNLNTSGNIEMVDQDDRFDDGVNLDGKLALYLKGKIKGKYLVTASVDTDRRPTRRGKAYQMRKLFTNLDPDKYYPVYGDASKISYDANDTQDELYLMVEFDNSHFKYGAFNTDIPLYNRTLQGAHAVYESVKMTKFGDPYTKINAFYARAYQVAAHDEFIGTGGSLYYIRHTPMIEGSEKVRVELRDQVSKQAIATVELTEEKDYEIDYDTGRILLKKPLSSVNYNYDADIISNDILGGSRAYLIIDYEYEEVSTIRKEAYGIKASQQIWDHIKIGGTYVEEQKTTKYYRLMGGDGTIKINQDTEVTAEYDRSEQTQLSGASSIDGGFTYDTLGNTANDGKSGSAFNVKGKTRLFNNTDINLGYSRQDDNFSATSTISTNGTAIYTGSIMTRLKENLLAGVKHVSQEIKDATLAADLTGNNKVHTTTALLDYKPGKWDMRLEYQHQRVRNPFDDYTYAGYRQMMSYDVIGGRVGYKLTEKLHPYIGGQGCVNGFVNNQGYGGVEYQIWENTYARLKETIGNLGNSTLFGLTSQITPETEAYTNIEVGNNAQIGDGEDGSFTKTSTGQKTKLDSSSSLSWQKDYSSWQENILHGDLVGYEKKLSDTLSLGANYERSFIEKEPTAISRDSGSVSLSYLDVDRINIFTKLEVREDRGGTDRRRQWLTQNSALWQVTQDISLLGRGNWSITDNRSDHTTDAQFHELGAGLAYRPVEFDRLNLLAKYSYITNQQPDSQNDFYQITNDIRNIYAVEGGFDICRYLQLIGKFAMRDMSEKVGPRDWTDSDTYLYIGRLNFHVTNKWDIAAEYRTLANRQIEDKKVGWLFEVDRELVKFVRLGAGYNFTDYDDDLSNSDNYEAKGWFIRLNGKY